MTTAVRHRQISDMFLDHAVEEYNKRDMLQASEKAWGALAHHVKSVAKERGWPNNSHQQIRQITYALTRLTDDPEQSRRMFSTLEALHTNFYEERYPEDYVWGGIADARALIDALKSAEPRFPDRLPAAPRQRS